MKVTGKENNSQYAVSVSTRVQPFFFESRFLRTVSRYESRDKYHDASMNRADTCVNYVIVIILKGIIVVGQHLLPSSQSKHHMSNSVWHKNHHHGNGRDASS